VFSVLPSVAAFVLARLSEVRSPNVAVEQPRNLDLATGRV